MIITTTALAEILKPFAEAIPTPIIHDKNAFYIRVTKQERDDLVALHEMLKIHNNGIDMSLDKYPDALERAVDELEIVAQKIASIAKENA